MAFTVEAHVFCMFGIKVIRTKYYFFLMVFFQLKTIFDNRIMDFKRKIQLELSCLKL